MEQSQLLESEGKHSEKEISKNRILLKLWIISSLISGGSSLRYAFEGRFEAVQWKEKELVWDYLRYHLPQSFQYKSSLEMFAKTHKSKVRVFRGIWKNLMSTTYSQCPWYNVKLTKKKQENLTNSPGEKQLGETNSDMTQMSELIDSFIAMIITLLKKVNENLLIVNAMIENP